MRPSTPYHSVLAVAVGWGMNRGWFVSGLEVWVIEVCLRAQAKARATAKASACVNSFAVKRRLKVCAVIFTISGCVYVW